MQAAVDFEPAVSHAPGLGRWIRGPGRRRVAAASHDRLGDAGREGEREHELGAGVGRRRIAGRGDGQVRDRWPGHGLAAVHGDRGVGDEPAARVLVDDVALARPDVPAAAGKLGEIYLGIGRGEGTVGGINPHVAAWRPDPSDRRVACAGGGPELADRLWSRHNLAPDGSAPGADHHAVRVPVLGVDVVAELHPGGRAGVSPGLPVGAGAPQRQAKTGLRVGLALDDDIPVADREHPGERDSRGIGSGREAGKVAGHQGRRGRHDRRGSPPRHGGDLVHDHGAAGSARIVELSGAGGAKHPALWLAAAWRSRDPGDLVRDWSRRR